MTDMKNGGPAFNSKWIGPDGCYRGDQGMTLRDWFAGQALAGIASISSEGFSLSPEDEAEWAYQRADAMLAARGDYQ